MVVRGKKEGRGKKGQRREHGREREEGRGKKGQRREHGRERDEEGQCKKGQRREHGHGGYYCCCCSGPEAVSDSHSHRGPSPDRTCRGQSMICNQGLENVRSGLRPSGHSR